MEAVDNFFFSFLKLLLGERCYFSGKYRASRDNEIQAVWVNWLVIPVLDYLYWDKFLRIFKFPNDSISAKIYPRENLSPGTRGN